MKTICPARSSGHSAGSGSLTLTIRSARGEDLGRRGDDLGAAARRSAASAMPEPSPAPGSTSTWWPARASSSTPTGKHGHAVFVALDFLGHADDHERSSEPIARRWIVRSRVQEPVSILQDAPQGAQAVAPADLLALRIGAAGVADRPLVDPHAGQAGDLGRQFRLRCRIAVPGAWVRSG